MLDEYNNLRKNNSDTGKYERKIKFMKTIILVLICIVLPYAATALGVVAATFVRNPSKRTEQIMLGFAAGVMMAASVWGLLIPAFDSVAGKKSGIIGISAAFILGIVSILLIDLITPHMHGKYKEGPKSKMPRSYLLVFAVAIHNLPEGLAMGVVLGAAIYGENVSIGSVLAMSIGLALQNFPEGLAVTFPLMKEGLSRKKSFAFGQISSIAEPICAGLGVFLAVVLQSILPGLLSFAAGAMFFVIVEELIPQSQTEESHAGTYGLLIGFWMMAVLAAALS